MESALAEVILEVIGSDIEASRLLIVQEQLEVYTDSDYTKTFEGVKKKMDIIQITLIQEALRHAGLDGWLLYDFRRTNDPACALLRIPPSLLLTRRFFYWIPARGDPVKIVHRIEANALAHLPGNTVLYAAWKELEEEVKIVLSGSRSIAMEYSPRNAIPTVSKVDAGTIELVRSFGISVESSADLLQAFMCVWTDEQFKGHCEAAEVLNRVVEEAWGVIGEALKGGKRISEVDVQVFMVDRLLKYGCAKDHPPICAVNAHSADPHYMPEPRSAALIQSGDFVLIDVWGKMDWPGAVYADITRVAVVGREPTEKEKTIFSIVRRARDAALGLLEERVTRGQTVRGYELDKACREVIISAGYGAYFPHRTGHSIGERDHGDGANIDSYETQDFRLLLPGTCFSIEPGIYLPGEFGVRLEDDVFLKRDGRSFSITPGMQTEILVVE